MVSLRIIGYGPGLGWKPRKPSTKKRPMRGFSVAGMAFRPSRIRRDAVKATRKPIGRVAAVYTAAVLEYISAEVIDLAGLAAEQLGRKRISPRVLQLAFRGDEELDRLLKDVIIPGAGVIPYIHQTLIKNDEERRSIIDPEVTALTASQQGPARQSQDSGIASAGSDRRA